MAEPLHNNDEILMKYLDGEMDPAKRALFEEQVSNNTALKERLQNLQLAIASVQHYGTAEKVKTIHSEMMKELSIAPEQSKVVPMRKVIRYSLAIAASIIIILVGVNLFSASSVSSGKLYNEAFVDYTASGVRGNEMATPTKKMYQEHNYKAVTENAGSRNLTSEDSLLVGLSYLKTNQVSPAINWFNSLSKQGPVKQDAEFYLALSYLKNENYGEALKMMERIHADPAHIYHNRFSESFINKVKKLSSKE